MNPLPSGSVLGCFLPLYNRLQHEQRFSVMNIISVAISIITSQDLDPAMGLVTNYKVMITEEDNGGYQTNQRFAGE
jgi:hypothetical protein